MNPAKKVTRNAQLDLLRAIAIVMVVSYHVFQMSPMPLPGWVTNLTHAGQYGVDVFFVLSGWLIGGLYWNEYAQFGNVELKRFWLRRCLRTMPPYFAALLLAWLAVSIQRNERFDWGYLVFIQNYYERIPFFLVSWSLCIEEHFYFFIPLLLAFAIPKSRTVIIIVFLLMVLSAPVFRTSQSVESAMESFGYVHTATHLRMEGLLLGFLLAFIYQTTPRLWVVLQRITSWLLFPLALLTLTLLIASSIWMYRLGLTVLALGISALLISIVHRAGGKFTSTALVKGTAQISYSVYLTHPLMIHLSRKIIEKMPASAGPAYFPMVLTLIGLGGVLFYLLFERTSIRLREHLVPRRSRATLPTSPC